MDGHLRGVLHAELGALSALPGSLVGLVTSMEKDFRPYLVPPEDTCRPPGSFFGEAVVGFVERYLGTADCEVARNRATWRFNVQQGLRVYYATTVLASLCPRRFSRWFSLSTVQRTVSRETAELHAAAQVSWRSRRHVRRYGASKGVPVGLSGGRCRLDTAYLCHIARFPPPLLSVCMTSTEHPPQ